MATILEISDGTTTVELNLDVDTAGFKLGGLEDAWEPTNPFYKGGGTWQQSPLSPGRQLVNKQFENIVDTFSVHLEGSTQDEMIEKGQDLKRIFEQSSDYWTSDWYDTPSYIKAKADNETNARYAIIYTGRVLRDGNPYGCRANGGVASANIYWMWDLTVIIEHGLWTENAPGTGTAVEISAVEAYDGRNLGNVDDAGIRDPTTANEVYVGTKRNEANLTDVYVDDGGVFGANLLDAALPQNLLPAVPAVNDAIYFGIEVVVLVGGPFCSLVFDIGTAGAGYTGVFEYWDGAAWANLASRTDNTLSGGVTPFGITGVNAVSWDPPSDWATTAVNGVTGYWVRMRVTAIPGALTAPTQQTRNVYSVVWPYVEIQTTQTMGDVPSLAEIEFYGRSDDTRTYERYASRIIWGLRSCSRGEDFTAYLNFSGAIQNPTYSYGDGVIPNSAVTFDIRCSAGYGANWLPAGAASDVNIGIVKIERDVIEQFYGKYHIFLRALDDTGTATISFYATYKNRVGQEIRASDRISYLEVTPDWGVMDLGVIEIPASSQTKVGNPVFAYDILIYATTDGAADVLLNDLIMIPVDQYAMDCYYDVRPTSTGQAVNNDSMLNMDGISEPKLRNVVITEIISTSVNQVEWSETSNGRVRIEANAKQRLWFFTALRRAFADSSAINISTPYNLNTILVYRNAQYMSMRGSR